MNSCRRWLIAAGLAIVLSPAAQAEEGDKKGKCQSCPVFECIKQHVKSQGCETECIKKKHAKKKQVVELLRKYHMLRKTGKYREAEILALKARKIDPENQSIDAAIYIVRILRQKQEMKQGCTGCPIIFKVKAQPVKVVKGDKLPKCKCADPSKCAKGCKPDACCCKKDKVAAKPRKCTCPEGVTCAEGCKPGACCCEEVQTKVKCGNCTCIKAVGCVTGSKPKACCCTKVTVKAKPRACKCGKSVTCAEGCKPGACCCKQVEVKAQPRQCKCGKSVTCVEGCKPGACCCDVVHLGRKVVPCPYVSHMIKMTHIMHHLTKVVLPKAKKPETVKGECGVVEACSPDVEGFGEWSFQHGIEGIDIVGPHLHGHCQHITLHTDWVKLIGDVHLQYKEAYIHAETVHVNVKTGRIELE